MTRQEAEILKQLHMQWHKLVKCKRVDWLKDRWVYYSDTNSFFWEEEISPIIHLQRTDEDRPFQVQDLVEWDRGDKIMHGIIVEMFPGGARVYNTDTGHPEDLELSALRFAKRRER